MSDVVFVGQPQSTLQPPSVDEVAKLIATMPAKSSPMNSILTSIIKSCADVFVPLITGLIAIIALSFTYGVFPTRCEAAAVTPLVKKKCLDKDDVANYRPNSNLHTILKIVERSFLSRVSVHVEQSPCYNRLQSAYRRGHSTETALLRLYSTTSTALQRTRQEPCSFS